MPVSVNDLRCYHSPAADGAALDTAHSVQTRGAGATYDLAQLEDDACQATVDAATSTWLAMQAVKDM